MYQQVAIVVPCFNEAEGIEFTYRAISEAVESIDRVEWRLVFVDDGSSDETVNILRELATADQRVTVVSLSRNFGHQIALSAGIDATNADAVVLMDADLQHPPELIPEMLIAWNDGHEVVSAVRRQTAQASWFKRLTSTGFYRLFNRLSETQIPDGAADFCLLSRRVVDAIQNMPERHRFLRGLVAWTGYKRKLLEYDAPARQYGETKYTVRKMCKFAFDACFAFSAEPLRFATRFGTVVTVLGATYLCYIGARWLAVGDTVRGWPSLLGTVLMLGGTQLIFLGVIGEYIARIYEQSKQRPLYLVQELITSREPNGQPTSEKTRERFADAITD